MNKIYSLRAAIKDIIVTANIGLAAEDIVIARQADIFREIEENVSRAKNGVCLVIGASSGRVLDPDDDDLDMEMTLSLQLWVAPIYDSANMPEEDIAVKLMQALHGHDMSDTAYPEHHYYWLQVTGWKDLADPDYLVREIQLRKRVVIKETN